MPLEFNLKQKLSAIVDLNRYNQRVAEELEKLIELDPRVFLVKLSCGNENPPMRTIDLYLRAVSVLRFLVENPQGCSKLRNKYSRMKNGKVKPVKRKPSSYFGIKKILEALEKSNLINKKEDLGYYTTNKGKQLLIKHL